MTSKNMRLLAFLAVARAGHDIGFEQFFTTESSTVWDECSPSPHMPAAIKGTYMVAGPSIFEMGGYKFKSAMDGFGKFHRFTVGDGKICYTGKMMPTAWYNESIKDGYPAPSMLFAETEPPRPPCAFPIGNKMLCDLKGANDNMWINSMKNGHVLSYMTDVPAALDFDMDSLHMGKHNWDDHILGMTYMATSSSAHPWRVADGHINMIYAKSLPPMFSSYVDFVKISDADDAKERQVLARFKADASWYAHSFGVAENYAVLPLNIVMNLPSITGGRVSMGTAFQDKWGGVAVVDLSLRDPKGGVPIQIPRIFDTEHFYHTHVANTFKTQNDSLIFDAVAFKNIPFTKSTLMLVEDIFNKTRRDSHEADGVLMRYEFFLSPAQKGKYTSRPLSNVNRSFDFVKINMDYSSKEYCFVYGVEWWHDDDSIASMSVNKVDVCSQGSVKFWYRVNCYPHEPTFIPRPNSSSEDDGFLAFNALNGTTNKNHFVILDAATMEEVSNTPTAVRVPFTAHAQFFSPSQRPAAARNKKEKEGEEEVEDFAVVV